MKKNYVKPVMESEEFVANEYIATCYQVYCKGYDATILFWNNHKSHGFIGDAYHDFADAQRTLHTKKEAGREGDACTIDRTEHFLVDIRTGAEGANAS